MTYYVEHYEKRDYVYPLDRFSIYIKLKTNIEHIQSLEFIYFEKIRDKSPISLNMDNFNQNKTSEFYFVKLTYPETIKYIDYYFKITTDKDIYYYSPEGLRNIKPQRSFCYSDTNTYDIFQTPEWPIGLVGYQIFPERFNIGKKVLIDDAVDWGSIPTRENFFGGNIQGIIDKVDYLKDLGVGLVYLTPVFVSNSNHKYDTIDYFEIDPSFGSKDDFKALVEKLHKHNIRLIIDGVFNHIGYFSKQFQDVIVLGKQSQYYDWFYINGDTVDTEHINYECVGYYKWMPKLRYESETLRKHILNVGTYWLEHFDIDGYRLDVADEVDFTLWHDFRKVVKETNKDALLIGETWKNGSDLLGADSLDSIMNYRLRDALLDLIVYKRSNIHEFRERIESIYFDYPIQTHHILYNTLGSHDTERIMTLCQDDSLKVNLLVSILCALPGIPFIYYGDEIGTKGANDPLCRKTMDWSQVNNSIHVYYKNQIERRHHSEALKYGDFKHIDLSDSVYSFIRTYNKESLIFIANITEQSIKLNLQAYGVNKEITLPGYGSEIIKNIKIT